MKAIKSEEDQELMLMNHGGMLIVGEAMIDKKGIHASNGEIHMINTVLMPPAKTEAKPMEKKGY
jgi:uncharacterized surface protein with fasciclin (FAS1) repeats